MCFGSFYLQAWNFIFEEGKAIFVLQKDTSIGLFEIWWALQECTVWFGCLQTNLPKPNSVIGVCPPYFKMAYWKVYKSMENLWRGTESKTRGNGGHSCPPCHSSPATVLLKLTYVARNILYFLKTFTLSRLSKSSTKLNYWEPWNLGEPWNSGEPRNSGEPWNLGFPCQTLQRNRITP